MQTRHKCALPPSSRHLVICHSLVIPPQIARDILPTRARQHDVDDSTFAAFHVLRRRRFDGQQELLQVDSHRFIL